MAENEIVVYQPRDYKLYVHIAKFKNEYGNYGKYFGITYRTFEQRWRNGTDYYKCPRFFNSIKKHGWDNFRHIKLFINLTEYEANELEKFFIKTYKTQDKKYGYNLDKGGKGTRKEEKNYTTKQETKNKISENHADVSGKNNPYYGRCGSLHTQSTPVINIKTLIIYEGVRDCSRKIGKDSGAIARYCKGIFSLDKESENWRFLEDYENNLTIDEIRIKYKNRYKEKLKIICLETKKVYNSQAEAEKEYNIKSGISECLRGIQKTAGGVHWMKYQDYLKENKIDTL